MKDKVILIITITICLLMLSPAIMYAITGNPPRLETVKGLESITGALIALISVYFGKEKL